MFILILYKGLIDRKIELYNQRETPLREVQWIKGDLSNLTIEQDGVPVSLKIIFNK